MPQRTTFAVLEINNFWFTGGIFMLGSLWLIITVLSRYSYVIIHVLCQYYGSFPDYRTCRRKIPWRRGRREDVFVRMKRVTLGPTKRKAFLLVGPGHVHVPNRFVSIYTVSHCGSLAKISDFDVKEIQARLIDFYFILMIH